MHNTVGNIFIVLVTFWCMWFYTEIREYFERDDFQYRVNEFMNNGERFTKEDGELLSNRIKALEEKAEE